MLAALLVLAVIAVAGGTTAQATTFTVCASGCDHVTIQAAVAAASAGDTISVAAGTYDQGSTSITVDKSLTFSGPNAAVSPNGGSRVAEAIIQGNAVMATFNVTSASATVVFQGFSFQTLGAEMRSDSPGATITLRKNVFTGTRADGMWFNDPNLTVVDNLFTAYHTTASETIAMDVTNPSSVGTLSITNNTWSDIQGNGALNLGRQAGASNLSWASGTVSNNTFNGVEYYGILVAYKPNFTISNNVFNNITNPAPGTSDTWGAGIRFYGATPSTAASVSGNTFSNSYLGVSVRTGGDITGASISVANNTFTGNTTDIRNSGTGTLAAASNWWGAVSGTGAITGVDTTPWCTSSSCSTLSDNANLTALSLSSGTLSPAFSASTTAYTASVGNGVTSVTVTAPATPGATAVITGGSNLSVGDNTVSIGVTSADGTAAKTYTVTVGRAAAAPPPAVDVCPNLSGVQAEVPSGFVLVGGQCVASTPDENAAVSAPAAPDQPGTVSVVVVPTAPPSGTATPPPVTVAVSWPVGTFTTPVTVQVTPRPELSAPVGGGTTPAPVAGGFSVSGVVFQLTVTSVGTGSGVTSFQAPLVFHLSALPAGDVPAYSTDGTTWTAIPRLETPGLPAGQADGYHVNADRSIDIYTRHATLFGLLNDVQAPSAPTLKTTIKGNKLHLLLQGATDNVRVASYRVLFNGRRLKATTRSYVVVPARPGRFQATAVDAAGNMSKRSAVFTIKKRAPAAAPVRSTPAAGTLKAHVAPVIGVPDGLLHVTLTSLPAQAVLVRIGGGLASGGKWFGWVPLERTGPSSWSSDLRAPGFLGVYPLQVRTGSKVVDAGPLVRILPRGFDRQPAFSTPEELADWWVRKYRAPGQVIDASEWHTGFFTHRDARFNSLLRVTVALPGRTETMFLSVARLRADGPWRLLEAVAAP